MKRLFGVYDERMELIYIGASECELDTVLGNIKRWIEGAQNEIARGKIPNSREIAFKRLLDHNTMTLSWLTTPVENWVELKRNAIKEARENGIILVNEATGGPGSEGVPLRPQSIARRSMSQLRITDEDVYQMHTMYHIENKLQRVIAAHFDITEKGVQKLLMGYRRAAVYLKWHRDHTSLKTAA